MLFFVLFVVVVLFLYCIVTLSYSHWGNWMRDTDISNIVAYLKLLMKLKIPRNFLEIVPTLYFSWLM